MIYRVPFLTVHSCGNMKTGSMKTNCALLHYTTGSTDESGSKPSRIVPGQGARIKEKAVGIELSAICFGYRMDPEACDMIQATINHKRRKDKIKFYQMKEDPEHPNNPLRLIPEPYPPPKPRKHRNSPVNSQ